MVLFALPLIAVNLLQVFYNAADMMIVGLSGEPDAVGAVGGTLPLINLIVNSFIGISVGANVALARSLGASDTVRAQKTVHTAWLLSLLLGVLACVIGIVSCAGILSAMGNRGRLLTLSVLYTRICFLGTPFLAVTNFSAALLRATGDSKSPLYVLSFTGACNVVCNLVLVLVCDMSVEGVALATLLSNALSAVLLTYRLVRIPGEYRLCCSARCMDRQAAAEILGIGVPAGLQSAVFSVSHLVIGTAILSVNNAAVSSFDTTLAAYQPVIKGNSAATNLEAFTNTAVNAVGQTAVTFVGQNAGANRYDRVRRVRTTAYALAAAAAAVCGIGTVLLRHPLLSLYGVAPLEGDPLAQLAYDSAETRLFVMMLPYVLLAFMEIGSGVLQGLSKPLCAAAVSIGGSVVFRLLWIAFVFPLHPTLATVFLSFPLSWLLTGGLHFCFAARVLGKLRKTE